VFIRLTGCPLRCQYCDTAYAFHGGEWWQLDAILERVREHGTRHVCVTGGEPLAQQQCLPLLGALAAVLVINISLVLIALQPLHTLERTAAEVRRGNTMARVPPSLLADRDMARVANTLNLLVDTLVQDRARSRELAALVISQTELDQLRIAHELHDSAAQQLAAQVMQISAIARDTSDALTRDRLEEVRVMASDTLEHLRALAREIRPGTRSNLFDRPGAHDDRAIERTSPRAAVRK